VNILAIEDHALFREGLRRLLQSLEPGVCVHEADSGASALSAIEEYGPELDLILLDLGLPRTRPFDVLASCRRLAPQVPVVVLSASEDRFEVERALALGAQAYLFKSSANAELLHALRRVMQGDIVAPGLSRAWTEQPKSPTAEALTPRQVTVLELLGRGLSNKEIASELGLTENTVKVHLAHVYRILDVTTRTAAVRKAGRAGLIDHE
jgi:DNA-binding NarL/FixJ family response regulator